MAEPDIRLLIGVETGGPDGGSKGLIERQLSQIMGEIKIDTGKFQEQIANAFEELNKSGKLSVKISRLELGKEAADDFRRQVEAALQGVGIQGGTGVTLSPSVGTSPSGATDSIRNETRALRAHTKALRDNAQAAKENRTQNGAASGMGATIPDAGRQQRSTVNIESARRQATNLLGQMQKVLRNYSMAKYGKSSESYSGVEADAANLQGYISAMRGVSDTPSDFADKMGSMRESLSRYTQEMNQAGEGTKSFMDRVGGLGKKFGEWLTVSRVVMAAWRAMKQMVTSTIELDSAMTQLKIVTGATDAEMSRFLLQATDLAKGLGKSISEMVSSIEVFSRLGYNLTDSSTLAKYAAILSNVAAVGQDEATTGITSIIKGYNMDVGNSEHVADVLVEVGQKYAVSAAEMMEAFEKSGAALNATNTSFEKSAGLIAAANASVQNASTVGTALKTISARIRGSKSELAELGEDTEELADGFSKYAGELKALTGFDIMQEGTTNQFKDIYDILGGIAQVWKDLSDTQQARVSEILGGTRQLQVISSIIGNWSDAANAYSDAMGSAGTAAKANETYLESVNGHIAQFRATFQELSYNLVDTGVISGVVDLGTGLLNIFNLLTDIINAVGGLNTVLLATVGILAVVNAKKIESVVQSFLSYIAQVKTVFASMTSETALAVPGVSRLSAVLRGLGVTASAAQLGIAGVTGAIFLLATAVTLVKRKQEEREKARQDGVNKVKEEQAALDDLARKYEALAKSGKRDQQTREQIRDIESQIVDIVGGHARDLDLVNGKLEDQLDTLREISREYAEQNIGQLQEEREIRDREYKNPFLSKDVGDSYAVEIRDALMAALDKGVELPSSFIDKETGLAQFRIADAANADELIEMYRAAKDALYEARKSGADIDSSLLAEIERRVEEFRKVAQANQNAYEDELRARVIMDSKRYDTKGVDTKEKFDSLLESVRGDESQDADYRAEMEKYISSLFPQFADAAEDAARAVGDLDNALKDAGSSLSKLKGFQEAYGTLSSVVGNLSENGRVLYSTLASIGEKFAGVDGIDGYIERLAHLRENGEDANHVLNELMLAYLKTGENAKDLAGASKDVVAAMLREIGVTNASSTAEEMLAYAKSRVAVETALSQGKIYEFIGGLDDEAKAAGVTQGYMVSLAASMITAENTNLSFRNQISALRQLYAAAGMARVEINSITGKMEEEVRWMKHYGFTDAQIQEQLSQITYEELNARFEEATKSFGGNFGGGDKNKGSGGSKRNVEEYIPELDRLYEKKEMLRRLELEMSRTEDRSENSDDLREKIDLNDKLVEGYRKRKDALHDLAGAQREGGGFDFDTARAEIRENLEKLEAQFGISAEYDPDTNELLFLNMEKLQKLTLDRSGYETEADWQEAVNERRKAAEELVDTILEENKAVQEWSEQWWEAHYNIRKTNLETIADLKEIVEKASESVDTLQNVYSTLQSAADEYAKSGGFLSVDTFQSIVALGPEYMQYISDENGLLVLNREAIQDVIRAKTEQLALENALSYVDRLRRAAGEDAVENLNQLVFAQEKYTQGQWAQVYATLEQLGLTDEQYKAAKHNIDVIRQLCIGVSADLDEVTDSIEDMRSGTDKILQWTMDMLKKRVEDEIQDLEDLKDAYAELIDKRKESLDTAKQEADYEDEVAEKVKEIAKLQTRINRLSMDDSRESQAQRVKLEEEMAQLQKELGDTQREHAIESQKDSLDQMQEDYEKQKDEEIDVLEDTISSYEKLYDMAMDYIGKNWNSLYGELVEWNHEYGNTIEEEITSEWDKAAMAVERYGSYVNAVRHFNREEYGGTSGGTVGSSTSGSSSAGGQNSVIGTSGRLDGSGSSQTVSPALRGKLSDMERNSAMWKSAQDPDTRRYLENENVRLSKEVEDILGFPLHRGDDGVWYLPDGRRFYDVYGGKFHSGGIVGGDGLKGNEVLTRLEKGETVLDREKTGGVLRLMEFTSLLTKGFDRLVAGGDLSKMFTGVGGSLTEEQRRSIENVSNRSNTVVNFGDTNIYGGNEETVAQHREINRKMVNDVIEQLKIKR